VANVNEQIRDVIIIGSGPAGYTAAIYTARAQLDPLVFEGSQYGGALMTTTEVENYPGFRDGIMGPDLMEQFRSQAERFGAELQSRDVTSVELAGDPKRVMVEDTAHLARSVILAMGAQPRYLNVPGEQELLGRGVSSCATCDGFFFRDQDIAVIGGGDSAMEEATFLTRFARSVTVVHRRAEFRASRIMLERARNNEKIHWRIGVTVEAVLGNGGVEGLGLSDGSTLDVTGMFVAIGHDPRSDLVQGQVDTDPDGYVLVAAPSTATSVDGVFAAGDLVDRTYRRLRPDALIAQIPQPLIPPGSAHRR
jgi:thioredoxin reductase (NADPH)